MDEISKVQKHSEHKTIQRWNDKSNNKKFSYNKKGEKKKKIDRKKRSRQSWMMREGRIRWPKRKGKKAWA